VRLAQKLSLSPSEQERDRGEVLPGGSWCNHCQDRKGDRLQNHSIRGFLSAQVTKKMKLKIEAKKSQAGERTYRIVT